MKRSTYLRICAGVELVGFIIGLIYYFVNMVTEFGKLSGHPEQARGWMVVIYIVGLVLIAFFGPALFVLFSSVADLLDGNSIASSSTKIRVSTTTTKPSANKFRKGQAVMSKTNLYDSEGHEVPDGCYGIIVEAPATGFPKVKFRPSTSKEDIILKVDPNSLEEWK